MHSLKKFVRDVSLGFAGGVFGALVAGLVLWVLGAYRVNTWLGVRMSAELSWRWLAPKGIYGGLWGLLLALPLLQNRTVVRGLAASLAPTLAQLLIIYPLFEHKGLLGLSLGGYAPLFVVGLNAIWGLAASAWFVYGAGGR